MDNSQNIGDWGENQMVIANSRIPYASTFVQTNDSDNDEPDESILYEKEKPDYNPEKIAKLDNKIPLSFDFVQTKDDDPTKIEGIMMEDPKIPLNLRLIQTNQDDDPEKMESMVMEEMDLPLNLRLIQTNQDDDPEKME